MQAELVGGWPLGLLIFFARPTAGEDGVVAALNLLATELRHAMGQAGQPLEIFLPAPTLALSQLIAAL